MPRLFAAMSTWLLTLAFLAFPQDPTPAPRIEWQRSLADALNVQLANGKPILICVNDDGEPFCERFATETYLDPSFVKLTEGYVCLVASPVHHNPRDYDSMGRRIECPRFPGVTCSEHVNVEPMLYARWFKEQRYAPRHVGVDQQGAVLFDHFLDRSMQDAIDDVQKHKGKVEVDPPAIDVDQLLHSSDQRSRNELERIYRTADAQGRRHLLDRCALAGNYPIDVLRMALREDDAATFRKGAIALAAIAIPECAIDLQDAIARCDDDGVTNSLEGTLARIAEGDKTLELLVTCREAGRTGALRAKDVTFAAVANAESDPLASSERDVVEGELDEALAARKKAPEDPAANLRVARANLALGLLLLSSPGTTGALLLEDARRAADQVATTDGSDALAAAAVRAIVSFRLGDAAKLPTDAMAAAALASANTTKLSDRLGQELLRALSAGCMQVAVAEPTPPPETLVTALQHAAFAACALLRHPLATDQDFVDGANRLSFLGLRREAQACLADALARFPSANVVHEAFRNRMLVDRGAYALLDRYRALTAAASDVPVAEWFSGYAALVCAELYVTDKEPLSALAAYDLAIASFAASARGSADFKDSADHFAVLAHAGAALILHASKDHEAAVRHLVTAKQLRPLSMSDKDGLQRTPEAILRRVQRELNELGKAGLAARLDG